MQNPMVDPVTVVTRLFGYRLFFQDCAQGLTRPAQDVALSRIAESACFFRPAEHHEEPGVYDVSDQTSGVESLNDSGTC